MFHIRGTIAERDGLEGDVDALAWVLVALEGVDVDGFSTFAALQSHLAWVVWEAASRYAEFWDTRLSEGAQSELDALCRSVAGLTPDTVRTVEPVPPTPSSSVDVAAWTRSRPDVLVSDVDTFDRAVPPRVLRSVLRDLGIRRIWKLDLPEESWSCEMDLAFVDTRCDWGECYWTPRDLTWILYVSHEAELVVGGAALVEAINRLGQG